PDTTCTTTSTFPGYCTPKAATCTTNADCPMSWTCTETPTLTTGGGVATGAPTSTTSTGGATGADVAIPSTGTLPPAPTMSCWSPLGTSYGAQDVRSAGTSGGGGSVPPQAGTPGGTTGSTTTQGAAAGTSPSAGCAVGGSSSGS